MKNEDIKIFFKRIKYLRLTSEERTRMLNKIQVRGCNKKNKIMTYKEFTSLLKNNKGRINSLVLGPKWNRLVFVDINIKV